MKKRSILLVCFSVVFGHIKSQAPNFRQDWRKVDPCYKLEEFTIENIIASHDSFLAASKANNNVKHTLYSYMYLGNDYLSIADYPKAMEYFSKAISLSTREENNHWKGWVNLKIGSLYMAMENWEKSISKCLSSLELCTDANDSLCMGESHERLSVVYAKIDSLALAHTHFKSAEGIFLRFAKDIRIAQLYANHGIVLNRGKRYRQAIDLYNKGGNILKEKGYFIHYNAIQCNLACALINLQSYDTAEQILQTCVKDNLARKYYENLNANYEALSWLFRETKEFEKAMKYNELYNHLNDSLMGLSVKNTISDLESKNSRYETELAAQKARIHAYKMKFFIGLLCLIGLAAMLIWYNQNRYHKAKQRNNERSLLQLTNLLKSKNQQLIELNSRFAGSQSETEGSGVLEHHLSTKILTKRDWEQFKYTFYSSYPNFVPKLRKKFNDLPESEERLLMLMKLRLKSSEIANILGISPESVKKTRQRVRKRIGIESSVKLEDFVKQI